MVVLVDSVVVGVVVDLVIVKTASSKDGGPCRLHVVVEVVVDTVVVKMASLEGWWHL